MTAPKLASPERSRPASDKALVFATACGCTHSVSDSADDTVSIPFQTGQVQVIGPNLVIGEAGAVILVSPGTDLGLDGITFRAAT